MGKRIRGRRGEPVGGRRAGVLALVLIPLNVYWLLYLQVVRNRGYASMLSLFFNVLFVLFLLVLANRVLTRLAPRWALTQAELLSLYVALTIGTATAQFVEYLVPLLAGPFRLAQPAGTVRDWLSAPLARALTVRNEEAARAFAIGNADMVTYLPLWIVPFLGWTLFAAVLLFTTHCLSTLFYRSWTDRERLPFPILRIPIQMTADGGREAFRSLLFWLGFAIAGGLTAWNGLATMFPSMPMLPIKRQAVDLFSGASAPWNVLGSLAYSLHPFVVGLGYFLPLDLTFSVGAFHLLHQASRVVAAAVGWSAENPRFPYVEFQSSGAWVALFVFAVWWARGHLQVALRRAWLGDASYRTAFLGTVGGFAALCLFTLGLGMSPWTAGLFFVIYFALVTAMTRARLELGPPAVDLFFIAPGQAMVALCGGKLLGPQSLASMSLFYWLWLEYPWHPMGHQVEARRIAEHLGPRLRSPTGLGLPGAALLGWTAAFLVVLHLDYTLGGATARQAGTQAFYTRQAYTAAQGWLSEMAPPDSGAIAAMVAGGAIAGLLSAARARILGWPLHPVGYALGSAFTTSYFWLPLWISALLKALIVRYGGLPTYRRLMPFALGLVLGEFVIGALWSLVDVVTGWPTYVFWPY